MVESHDAGVKVFSWQEVPEPIRAGFVELAPLICCGGTRRHNLVRTLTPSPRRFG
jgi:hypothetical protein